MKLPMKPFESADPTREGQHEFGELACHRLGVGDECEEIIRAHSVELGVQRLHGKCDTNPVTSIPVRRCAVGISRKDK